MGTKKKVSEDDVLKALEELEGTVEKGGKIPEEMKDANGGLATEGKDLAEEISASEGGEGTKKSDSKKPEVFKGAKPKLKKNEDESSEGEEGSDEDSSDEDSSESEMSKAYSASDESSSGSEEMSKSKKKAMKKSLREAAEEKPEIKKAMDVSNFIESLVDQVSDSDSEMAKALYELAEEQSGFNNKLAKAMIAMGRRLVKAEEINTELHDMVKALVEKLDVTPNPSRGRKAILEKADLVDRKIGGDRGENGELDHRDPRVRKAMGAWLTEKAMAGEVPSSLVIQYESGHDINPSLFKKAEPDLKKALG